MVNWRGCRGIQLFQIMRRKISIIGLLLLALCVSGWSSALAAALYCPHAKSTQARAMMRQDHSCCRAKLARAAEQQQPPHCSTAASHQAMTGEAQAMPVADAAGGEPQPVAQPAGSCAHCVDRSEIPASPTFGQANRIERNADATTSRKATPLAPFAASFAPQVLSRQGSPPGAQARKHLLISVFII
ncbi:MAG: hypothetical protein WCF57_24445 [Pyrinomonadaceae bacterium]